MCTRAPTSATMTASTMFTNAGASPAPAMTPRTGNPAGTAAPCPGKSTTGTTTPSPGHGYSWPDLRANGNRPAEGHVYLGGVWIVQVGDTITADTWRVSDPDGMSNARLIYQWLADYERDPGRHWRPPTPRPMTWWARRSG